MAAKQTLSFAQAIAVSITAAIVTQWLFNNVPAVRKLTEPRQGV